MYLIDYKGKFTIACDKLSELGYKVGTITRKELIKQAENRKVLADYYGVPAYIGNDEELNNIFSK